MKEFNAPFFALYEHVFIEYLELHGVKSALQFFERLFARALSKAYLSVGFTQGNPENFAKVVKGRDESVGLAVNLPLVTEDKIIYQFHQDPFPNLKNFVSANELDHTYINFKVKFLLGEGWSYTTTQHIWNNAPFTEHIIYKK